MKSLFFVGNYTAGTDSKGIYSVLLDEQTGALEIVSTCDACENPSYLAYHNNTLYVANELADKAYLTAYQVSSTGTLTCIDTITVPGAGACYLHMWPNGKYVSGADYSTGDIFTCSLKEDGTFLAVVDQHDSVGKSVDPVRQTGPHAHSITSSNDGLYWLRADLGTDVLTCYQADLETGKMEEIEEVQVVAGEGPRHCAYDQTGQYVYLVTELQSNIYVYERRDNKLSLRQVIPANLDTKNDVENYAAHIMVSKDNQKVYVSNRGADTIAVFKRLENGELSSISSHPSGGKYPRHFAFSPSGNYVVIAHQKSHEVVACRMLADDNVGEVVSRITIPKAINVCFAK